MQGIHNTANGNKNTLEVILYLPLEVLLLQVGVNRKN